MKTNTKVKVLKRWVTRKNREASIRPLKRTDVDALLSFINALIEEDTYILMYGAKMTRSAEVTYVTNALKQIKNKTKIHCIVEVDGVLAGSCEIRVGEKRKSHTGEIGISLLKEYREEGIGTVCMEVLISEAKRLGLRLLHLQALSVNERAIHVYEKLGFRQGGVVPQMYYFQGKYVDDIIMFLPLL